MPSSTEAQAPLRERIESPWLTRAAVAAVAGVVFLACCFDVQNYDVWWHLKTGELTAQRGWPFRVDPYSFASGGARWVNSGWLAQVGMHLLFKAWSFPGLILAKALIIALCVPVLYAACRGKGASLAVFALVVLWAFMAARFRFRVRPVVLSGLLCSVFVWLLDAHERTETRRVWLLAPLMLVWANVHPGFPAGFILMVLYFLSAAWRARRLRAFIEPTPARRLMWVGLAAAGAALLNPWHIYPFLYPVRLTLAKEFMKNISEWGAPSFNSFYAPFWLYMLAGLSCVGATWRRLTLSDALLLVVFCSMAVTASRHIFFFAFVSVPIFAKHATLLWQALAGRLPVLRGQAARAVAAAAPFLLAAAVVVKLIAFESVFPLGLGLRKGFTPKAAVDFIEAQNLPNNICNAYQWGGYLSWRCYPRRQIYIDGRCLVYGKEKFAKWQAAVKGEEGWDKTFARLHVNTLLFTHDLPLAIVRSPEWRTVYWDDVAVVLVRVAAAPEAVARFAQEAELTLPFLFGSNWADPAKRHAMVAAFKRRVAAQPDCITARVLLARCLGQLGQLPEAIAVLEAARKLEPTNTLLLTDLAHWLSRAGQHEKAIAVYREVVRLSPRHAVAYYGLGVSHAALGRWSDAEAALRRAVRLRPDFAAARLALSDALDKQGKSREAKELRRGLQASKGK